MPINSFEYYPMSWKPRKEDLSPPLYQSLADLLEYDILNHTLPPHTKLPPQRELADFLDINLSTVTRAFGIVQKKGLLYATLGRGTFVAPSAGLSKAIRHGDPDTPLIEMGMIHPLDSFNHYTHTALTQILAKGHTPSLLDYSNPLGSPYQKAAALKWLARFQLFPDPQQVLITTGAQNALSILLISLFQSGDKIATDQYTYSNFIELANMLGRKLVPIKGDAQGMRPEELDAQCNTLGIQGVYLMPTFSNPTGTLMNTPRKEALAKVIHKHSLTLIEDDIYAFLAPKEYVSITSLVPHLGCYIASLSKSLCAGLRVGFLVVPPTAVHKVAQGIYNINVKTTSLSVEAASLLIHSGVAGEIVEGKREESTLRNRLFATCFPEEMTHTLAFARWLPLPKQFHGLDFETIALEKKLHLYHSNRFLVGEHQDMEYLRLSLTSTQTREELIQGLSLLQDIFAQKKECAFENVPLIV